MNLADKSLVFVTGKGGVGKTTIAAAIAAREAASGRKVLLVEMGTTGAFESLFALQEVGFQARPTAKPNFYVSRWQGEDCLRDYVVHILKIEKLYSLFFGNKVMQAFLDLAPGLWELAILGKITSGVRSYGPAFDWDLVVMDCYSTGHVKALFKAPKAMADIIKVGPMGEQSRNIHEVLSDRKHCEFVLVSLAEEMPVVESCELFDEIDDLFGFAPTLICNRILNPPVSHKKIAELAEQQFKSSAAGFIGYLKTVVERQHEYLRVLENKAGRLYGVPLIFDSEPLSLYGEITNYLMKEWNEFDRTVG